MVPEPSIVIPIPLAEVEVGICVVNIVARCWVAEGGGAPGVGSIDHPRGTDGGVARALARHNRSRTEATARTRARGAWRCEGPGTATRTAGRIRLQACLHVAQKHTAVRLTKMGRGGPCLGGRGGCRWGPSPAGTMAVCKAWKRAFTLAADGKGSDAIMIRQVASAIGRAGKQVGWNEPAGALCSVGVGMQGRGASERGLVP